MRKYFVYNLFFILLLFHLKAAGQIIPVLSFDKDTIEIGETARLKIRITGRTAVNPIAVQLSCLDSIKILKVTDQESTIEDRLADIEIDYWDENSSREWQNKELTDFLIKRDTSFNIRFWDVGYHFVSNIGFSYSEDSVVQNQGGASILVLPPGKILNSEADSIDLAPLKPIIKEPVKWSDYRNYVFGAAGLALLFLLYFLYRKFKKKDKPVENVIEIKRPAHDIALDELYQLEEAKLWQKGEIKAFQSELTHIIREYLENRFEIPALESTTDTILHNLRNELISDDYNVKLKEILQIADLVKFAKAKPEIDIHQRFLEQARDFVKTTKKVEISQEELEND